MASKTSEIHVNLEKYNPKTPLKVSDGTTQCGKTSKTWLVFEKKKFSLKNVKNHSRTHIKCFKHVDASILIYFSI